MQKIAFSQYSLVETIGKEIVLGKREPRWRRFLIHRQEIDRETDFFVESRGLATRNGYILSELRYFSSASGERSIRVLEIQSEI